MKKIIYFGLIAVAISSVILLVIKKSKSHDHFDEKLASGKTHVKVDMDIIELGEVSQNSSIGGKYIFHNLGTESFIIENILTNCSCTQSEYTKSPVKPKESTTVVLKYDSTRLGFFQSTGIVTSNADSSRILLVLRGNVVSNQDRSTK